jgi:FkbM family methyltransferase
MDSPIILPTGKIRGMTVQKFMSSKTIAISLSRQRWLPYKTRRSVIKKLHPSMLADFAFETAFFDRRSGLRFAGNIGNYIDRMVYFCGAYEKYMLSLLRDYALKCRAREKRSLTFMDIGANAGNHSLFMSRHVAHVHAFEPFERVRKQLMNNLALNRITNVTVHPFGLSDENKTLPFYAAPDSNLGASSFQPSHTAGSQYLGDMALKRGDETVVQEHIKQVDIVKADVEGYEKFVLAGLKETLKLDRPLVVVELSPTTRETLGSAEAFYALFPPDYRFYYFARGKHDSGHYRLAPFDYAVRSKIHDVIAVANEKLSCLRNL